MQTSLARLDAQSGAHHPRSRFAHLGLPIALGLFLRLQHGTVFRSVPRRHRERPAIHHRVHGNTCGASATETHGKLAKGSRSPAANRPESASGAGRAASTAGLPPWAAAARVALDRQHHAHRRAQAALEYLAHALALLRVIQIAVHRQMIVHRMDVDRQLPLSLHIIQWIFEAWLT